MSATLTKKLVLPEIDVDAVRAALIARIETDGRPLAQIAPETGVPYPTLALFRNAKYEGTNENVAVKVQAYLDSLAEREEARAVIRTAPPFLMTPTAEKIFQVLNEAQALATMVVVPMSTGIGKTTAVETYAKRYTNVWVVTAQPCFRTDAILLAEVCEALGVKPAGGAAAMSRAIARFLRGKGGLLIVDEAQHLTAERLNQLRSTVLDASGGGSGLALVGGLKLEKLYQELRVSSAHAELARRAGMRLYREKATREDIRMVLDAWGLENAKAREKCTGIALKLGSIGTMTQTLRLAYRLSDARGEAGPTDKDVMACYEQLGGEGA